MALSGLRIANFKAFSTSQRVPLRPITLVFGANSAGKSSLLHALALAHHAVGTGELDTQRTEIGGEAIDLGGFRQYVHRRERSRQVELGFDLDPGRLSGRVAEFLRPARCAGRARDWRRLRE
jgi:predicted ATPase